MGALREGGRDPTDLSRQWSPVGGLASQGIFGNFWRFFGCHKCPTIFDCGVALRHLEDRGQGHCQTFYSTQESPRDQNCLVQGASSVCCSENPALRARYLEIIILAAA